MKVILFLCLALIASQHLAEAISRAEIISLLQQDYTIDKVLQLFEALRTQENQDLTDIDNFYAVEEPRLSAEIVRTNGLLTDKTNECNGIETLLNGQITDRDNQQYNVNTAKETIDSNNNKVKTLEDARCAANILFIGRLKENQEATKFLSYLREKISAPEFREYLAGNAGAFLQLRTAIDGSKTDEILSLLAQHHILSLLQQEGGYEGENNLEGTYNVKARTAEEIGTGHIDNTRGALERRAINNQEVDVDGYITKITSYLDELLSNFATSTKTLQSAEQDAVQALIDYKVKIEDQNYVLGKYIDATNNRIADLGVVIENNQKALSECRDQIPPLEEGVRVSQSNYDTYVKNYNDRRSNLVNTIDLLGKVIEIYTNEVVNAASSEYKERTEDFLGDETFDTTGGFTTRETTGTIAGYQG